VGFDSLMERHFPSIGLFEQLCIQCPHHQIPDQLLIQYFYEGLMPTDRSIIDAACGGALVDKKTRVCTPINLKHGSQLETMWHVWRLRKQTSK
jgi:hypothetical protein